MVDSIAPLCAWNGLLTVANIQGIKPVPSKSLPPSPQSSNLSVLYSSLRNSRLSDSPSSWLLTIKTRSFFQWVPCFPDYHLSSFCFILFYLLLCLLVSERVLLCISSWPESNFPAQHGLQFVAILLLQTPNKTLYLFVSTVNVHCSVSFEREKVDCAL